MRSNVEVTGTRTTGNISTAGIGCMVYTEIHKLCVVSTLDSPMTVQFEHVCFSSHSLTPEECRIEMRALFFELHLIMCVKTCVTSHFATNLCTQLIIVLQLPTYLQDSVVCSLVQYL